MFVLYNRMTTLVALLVMSAPIFAGCTSCAERMAIKKSIQDAQAAAQLAKPSQHLDQASASKPCCQSCANGGNCEGKRCQCSAMADDKRPAQEWVMIDNDASLSCCAQLNKIQCLLDALAMQGSSCCKKVNKKLKELIEDTKKCCKHTRNDLEDIEDLILSQTDQAADCCSVIEARIGDLCLSSVVDRPEEQSIVDFVDSSCFDMTTWLKNIYALVAQIWYCTCNI